jgi:hypothetical protein
VIADETPLISEPGQQAARPDLGTPPPRVSLRHWRRILAGAARCSLSG